MPCVRIADGVQSYLQDILTVALTYTVKRKVMYLDFARRSDKLVYCTRSVMELMRNNRKQKTEQHEKSEENRESVTSV